MSWKIMSDVDHKILNATWNCKLNFTPHGFHIYCEFWKIDAWNDSLLLLLLLLQVSWLRPAFDSFLAFVPPAVSIVHGPYYLLGRSTQHVLQLIHKFQALPSSCSSSSDFPTYYDMLKLLSPHNVSKKLQLSNHTFFKSSLFCPVCCNTSSFVFLATYDILCILRRHHISNALIALLSSAFKVQASQPYSKMGCT